MTGGVLFLSASEWRCAFPNEWWARSRMCRRSGRWTGPRARRRWAGTSRRCRATLRSERCSCACVARAAVVVVVTRWWWWWWWWWWWPRWWRWWVLNARRAMVGCFSCVRARAVGIFSMRRGCVRPTARLPPLPPPRQVRLHSALHRPHPLDRCAALGPLAPAGAARGTVMRCPNVWARICFCGMSGHGYVFPVCPGTDKRLRKCLGLDMRFPNGACVRVRATDACIGAGAGGGGRGAPKARMGQERSPAAGAGARGDA